MLTALACHLLFLLVAAQSQVMSASDLANSPQPPAHARIAFGNGSLPFGFDAARAAGDSVELAVAPESGHFEIINPASSSWPLVEQAAQKLLSSR